MTIFISDFWLGVIAGHLFWILLAIIVHIGKKIKKWHDT